MPTGMRRSKSNVVVSLLSGRSFQMSCGRGDVVEDFKKALAKQTGMDWFGQRLYHEWKELQSEEALGVAGVKQNADLALVFDEEEGIDFAVEKEAEVALSASAEFYRRRH